MIPANTRAQAGLAIDLGTSAVCLSWVRLDTGEELASHFFPNPQNGFGKDIISRLSYASNNPVNGRELQRVVLDSVADEFRQMLTPPMADPTDTIEAVLVGNTVMHHIALGLPTKGLISHPYAPATLEPGCMAWPGLPACYFPPVIGSFVGSDLVAALIASNIQESRETCLLIDVGTNSEVLLSHRGSMYACSAPAGPAFEGKGISCGMQALPGAVYGVTPGFGLKILDGGKPIGICGSGILDALKELITAGLLNQSGLMIQKAAYKDRISEEPDGSLRFTLADGVFITQKDVRAVQLAKGALESAFNSLAEQAGITMAQIQKVYLAGAFGSSLNVENVSALGLIPDVKPQNVYQLGNAALVGAKAVLLSKTAKRLAEELSKTIKLIDLVSLAGFQEKFLSSLSFGNQKTT